MSNAEEEGAPTASPWPVFTPFAKEHYGRGVKDGMEKGRAEGMAEGMKEGMKEASAEGAVRQAARMLMLVINARGWIIPPDIHTLITTTSDLDTLEDWILRSATVQTPQELFDERDRQPE
ncbi:hypothetical protein MF672_025585 [Actinomadura sp. ATCC 31491]|uniref:Flagellar assembly protein H n=1 Tax=Actinomadura luzonensis TaxID=2805427 RepID=A0ABT0FXQ1_9ACTN|nr:hypothetical protein [Actinomadura luzonensis]MCK2217134.1 hypothetical protein [Actinomadura luzonensis]